jgi:hypothetical protein
VCRTIITWVVDVALLLLLLPLLLPGELAMTYLDEQMRISRGDKGNLFVLLMDDPDARP